MNKKISQGIMIWFLPVIVIGGLFWPLLGYIVFFFMLFFLILSYFKGRYWCSHLCPRGAFLDLALDKFSLKKSVPKIFLSNKFRWEIFAIFMSFFILQFILAEKNIFSFGFVFVRMCLVTTLIAIFLGIPTKARAWCVICPMGTLQTKVHSINKRYLSKKEI